MKIDYKIVHKLREQSGFGWDLKTSMVTAPDNVWDAYIRSHPRAKRFRKTPFPQYDKCHELCRDIIATGAASFNGAEPAPSSPSPGRPINWRDSSSEHEEDGDRDDDDEEDDEEAPYYSITDDEVVQPSSKKQRTAATPTPKPSLRDAVAAKSELTHKRSSSAAAANSRKKHTHGAAFHSISESMDGLLGLANGEAVSARADPLSEAVSCIEEDTNLTDEEKLDAIDMLVSNDSLARAFIAIGDLQMRSNWIRRRLSRM